MHRLVRLFAWIYVALCVGYFVRSTLTDQQTGASSTVGAGQLPNPLPNTATGGPRTAGGWFARARPFCNSVEVKTRMRIDPPPAGLEGAAYGAACFALAGQIDSAHARLEHLAPSQRAGAAGIVFEIGHPVADMGDDRSAGPILELVLEYQPDHYMALYHAGASEFELKQFDRARQHLERFLHVYTATDGWSSNARRLLEQMGNGSVRVERNPADSTR